MFSDATILKQMSGISFFPLNGRLLNIYINIYPDLCSLLYSVHVTKFSFAVVSPAVTPTTRMQNLRPILLYTAVKEMLCDKFLNCRLIYPL